MAMPEDEPHWISKLAARERARRERIEVFQTSAPTFVKLLANEIASDVGHFEMEFPGGKCHIEAIPEKGTITVICSGYQRSTSATVQMHPHTQRISCSYENCGSNREWEETLEISALGIHSKDVSPDYTAKRLSEKILKPVLFPAL